MNHLKCTLLVFSAALLTACGKNENIYLLIVYWIYYFAIEKTVH